MKLLLTFLIISSWLVAQTSDAKKSTAPLDIPAQRAIENIEKQVEPEYGGIAKAASLTGTVKVQFEIDTNGNTRNPKIISGNGMFIQTVLNALAKWHFKPFLDNGNPIIVRTILDIQIPTHGLSDDEKKTRKTLDQYFELEPKCVSATNTDNVMAEKLCKDLLALTLTLPENVYIEKSIAMAHLGSLYYRNEDYPKALNYYLQALELREKHQKPDEAEVGQSCMAVAMTYQKAGDLTNSSKYFKRGIDIVDLNRKNSDWEESRGHYVDELKYTIPLYINVLNKTGQTEEADRMNTLLKSLK